MKSLIFLCTFILTASWGYANTTKEDFVNQITGKMPANLCKKIIGCYSSKQADCETKMKPTVKKCTQSADGLFGRTVSPQIGKASSMLISACSLRYFASENAGKLNKKDKKCEEFSATALRY